MPLAKCSSAVISEAESATDRAAVVGLIVLAESLVSVVLGALPSSVSCNGDNLGLPR
jgi:phosphohistidine swiveling domain-containing protein